MNILLLNFSEKVKVGILYPKLDRNEIKVYTRNFCEDRKWIEDDFNIKWCIQFQSENKIDLK